MSEEPAFEIDMEVLDLHRDEEDLIDYEDSDIEFKIEGDERSSIPNAIDALQLDIYSDDAARPEAPAQKSTFDNKEESGEQSPTDVVASTSSSTKTPQAATLIKSLQDLLAEPTFQTSLGLSASDDVVNLAFWANGSDFALTLKLVGVADAKACKFGAKCFRADCTFDHGDADRSLVIAAGQRRKLCTVINTPSGCAKGQACWFSHEAESVSCTHGSLRDTCSKGPYCFYRHDDDAVAVSTEAVPFSQVEVGEDSNTEATKDFEGVVSQQVISAGGPLRRKKTNPAFIVHVGRELTIRVLLRLILDAVVFRSRPGVTINTPQGKRGRKAQAHKDSDRAGGNDASKKLVGSGEGSGNGKGGKGNRERSLRSKMTCD
ncbi:hypothetical protein N0V94_006497 [Neodidymelliopsis sp. IMI 364377]|nr:hypothetical protein N0V94_006497 [Neodidymelliopsis sp. IMI 364377]